MSEIGAPKTNKASKKGKKSWRKNVDMTEINQFLEEKRFEERVGGNFEERSDADLFSIDKDISAPSVKVEKRVKPLRCFANLKGLPGAKDPISKRNHSLKPEERQNPIVKAMKKDLITKGKIQKKHLDSKKDRALGLVNQKKRADESKTRRRTKFDHDLWGKENGVVVQTTAFNDEWIAKEGQVHNAIGNGKYTPNHVNKRNLKTGTLLPAVEVPDAGASYNPNLEDHQELLWKATIVEIEKEKELKKVERATTEMFPSKNNAPGENGYIQEMSEGILELPGSMDEEKLDEENNMEDEEEEGLEGQFKPKTRKQKRDKRKRMFEDQKLLREKNVKTLETDIFRSKSINKNLVQDEKKTEENQLKKEEKLKEKMSGPLKLSNYKFEAQEIELKLTDELTGNLRNLKQEGSLLEDRFKSLQKRNMIEVRVKQKTVRQLKRKTFEKRSHKMGWEQNKNKIFKKTKKSKKIKTA